jgi:ectoine hydroxylase
MLLTQAQREQYDRDGFIVLPGQFTPDEVAAMKQDLRRIQQIDTDHLVRERTGGVAKTIYRVHEADGPTTSPIFHAAARAPRLLGPAQALLNDEALYIHHTKCNLKTAIDGSVWQWHQDYGSWRRDGVPDSTMTTALVMLDEPTEIGGCLYFIPGSHKVGNLEPEMDDHTSSYRLWVVPKKDLVAIMERSPEPAPIIGPPGTVVFFHCNILHASGHNLSRYDRWAIYYVYNRVANRPADVPDPRPDYVRSRNWTPLPTGSDDILAPLGRALAAE